MLTPIITPATPQLGSFSGSPPHEPSPRPPSHSDMAPSPDPNLSRMRGWGFPQGPITPATSAATKALNRHSFFGLSFDPSQSERRSRKRRRPSADRRPLLCLCRALRPPVDPVRSRGEIETPSKIPSVSVTSSAFSFISGYLKSSPSPAKSLASPDKPSSGGAVKRELPSEGPLDFRKGCKCCVGEVIEF